MTLIIYWLEDYTNNLDISNFEYFINYGIHNKNWGSSKCPATNIILFVNDKTSFLNQYHKYNLNNEFIQIIILETMVADSISIISQFYRYIEQHNNLLMTNITNIFFVNSKLIGPILDPDDINTHWIDILSDKINTETFGVKHFTKNMLLFNYVYYQNRTHELKKLTNIDIFIFRKNTLPFNFNHQIYKTYLSNCRLINSYNDVTHEYLIYHYLKYNKTPYDLIISSVEQYVLPPNTTTNDTITNDTTTNDTTTYDALNPNTVKYNTIIHDTISEECFTLYECKDKTINIISKETFREACLQQLPAICNVTIPTILLNQPNESVLIEFRWFEHLDFLLRNMILKLPEWSHTVVCGNNNVKEITDCCNKISESIRIIKLDIDNINQSEYSALLMTTDFWNNFYGEKLLIYQEDSFLFHSKGIDAFMKYDYVGAPWLAHQDDNSYGVGNGGFSLRSKSAMLEVIDKVRPESLVLAESTKEYMKNTNSYVLPEDVYFSKSLIDFQIGQVAPRNIAAQFSQECVKGINPLGGHNFFLANYYDPAKINLGLIKRTNRVGFYSPYPFTLGGGEKYLTDLMKFFIEKDYQIVFYTNTHLKTVINTLKIYEIDIVVNNIKIHKLTDLKLINIYNITYDYFVEMCNNANPDMPNHIPSLAFGNKIAHKHIFHCQFPEFVYINEFNQPKYIDTVIVNSEFTNLYIKKMYNNSCILYPQCEFKQSISNASKKNNSFITIGRLFPYTKMANNKNIDRIIETFIKLQHLDFTLTVVGSVKNKQYFNQLQELVMSHSLDNKITFYVDVNDDEKIQLLNESEYYIHATGIMYAKDVMPHEEEHFGISPIEGIMAGCVLISADRGYPPYYINHSKNGFLYDSIYELQNIIMNICVHEIDTIPRDEIDSTIEYVNKTFGYKSYICTLTKILMNI